MNKLTQGWFTAQQSSQKSLGPGALTVALMMTLKQASRCLNEQRGPERWLWQRWPCHESIPSNITLMVKSLLRHTRGSFKAFKPPHTHTHAHHSVQAVPLTFPPLLMSLVLEHGAELSKGPLHYWRNSQSLLAVPAFLGYPTSSSHPCWSLIIQHLCTHVCYNGVASTSAGGRAL